MMKTFLTSLLSLSIFFVIGIISVSAQPPTGGGNPPTGGGNPTIDVTLNNPFKCGNNCSLFVLLKNIINDVLMPIGGVIVVLAFIYTGFLYVTAQGKEAQITTAHKALLYTSIGAAVLLGAWVLANVICQTIAQLGGPSCPS